MNEVDDRLVGDPVWELFPATAPAESAAFSPRLQAAGWIAAGIFITLGLIVFPPLAVVTICGVAGLNDIVKGRRLSRSIPDRGVAAVCSRFSYAWGACKVGFTAVALMFASVMLLFKDRQIPSAFVAAFLLVVIGFTASAGLTALGLLAALRSGNRVWVGEGINRARGLLLGMLLVGFTGCVLIPWIASLMSAGAGPFNERSAIHLAGGMFGCMFVAPVIMLLLLDWISRRVVADRPGKFGPKVPTVGKWNV